MEEEVELADGQGAQVALLAVEGEIAVVAALLSHVLGGVDEHAAGAGGGVADAHALPGLEQLDDEPDHWAWSVELAALLAGVVGEPVDEVFVGVSQYVADAGGIESEIFVSQVEVAEVDQKALDDSLAVGGTAELGFVVPVGWG